MHRAPQELRTYFTTFSTADRQRIFQVRDAATLMVSTLMSYRVEGRFQLHAYVVMPDHVHLLLTPSEDVSLEKSLQYIRGGFSVQLHSRSPVWERGHFDKRVPDLGSYLACITYIHQNPVKAGLVKAPGDYAFSSSRAEAEVDRMPDWLLGTQG